MKSGLFKFLGLWANGDPAPDRPGGPNDPNAIPDPILTFRFPSRPFVPPDGNDVTLSFNAVPYTPPTSEG